MCAHVVGVSHVYIDTSLDIISTFCYGWTSREGPSKVYISRRHTSAMVGVGEVIQRLKPIVTTAERALDATSSIRVDDGLNRGIGAHSEDEDT
jgi:hypothetical protein